MRSDDRAFVLEELAFHALAKSETRERSVGANYAMARDDQADRIRGSGAADGSGAALQGLGQITVAAGFTEGDSLQSAPNAELKRRSHGRE